MRRKKKHEEHVNHEAWAIPYADLMTLLLAFFVVMYAVSVVNEGKFRVMSASIVQAFNGSSHVLAPIGASAASMRVVTPIPFDAPPASLLPPMDASIPSVPVDQATAVSAIKSVAPMAKAARPTLVQIERQVRQALQPLIDKHWVTVRHGKDWLEIEIRTDILFPSGVAQLSSSADQVLDHVAAILAPFPNPLRVEGFTDNVPISTPMYPSNWELSAARAASVARLFAGSGVQPGRMGIVGWGDVKPVADNATADGRNRNRRILVLVMAEQTAPNRTQDTLDQWAGQSALAGLGNTDTVLPTQYVTAPVASVKISKGAASTAVTTGTRSVVADHVPVVVHASLATAQGLSGQVQSR